MHNRELEQLCRDVETGLAEILNSRKRRFTVYKLSSGFLLAEQENLVNLVFFCGYPATCAEIIAFVDLHYRVRVALYEALRNDSAKIN